jgi:hypothetical protein
VDVHKTLNSHHIMLMTNLCIVSLNEIIDLKKKGVTMCGLNLCGLALSLLVDYCMHVKSFGLHARQGSS